MYSKNPYQVSLGKYSTHSILTQLVGRDNDVLDFGCNEGYLGEICDPSNRFSGIEMMPSAAAKARSLYIRVVEGDLDYLDEINLSDQFDILIFADVLEHLRYPEKVLKEACLRWLRPYGRVLISLPNIANWKIRFGLLFGAFNYQETGILDRTHLHFYTFRTSLELITSATLRPLSLRSGATFFGPLLKVIPFARGLLSTNIIIEASR